MAIGPFLLSMPRLYLVLGIIAALIVAHFMERLTGSQVERPLWLALLAGLVAARMGYVLAHLDHFGAHPWEALYLWQGGYMPLAGAAASIAAVAWFVMARGYHARRIGAPLLAGLVMWGTLGWVTHALEQGTRNPLPDLQVRTLADEPESLRAFAGKPLVVNLWATWCPPCRREMPVLEEVQQARSDVRILLVNQGEGPQTIQDYLAEEELELDHVLLDPASSVGRHFNAFGMPTTFFFSEDGDLVDQHIGEITRPQLGDYLDDLTDER